MKNQRSFFAGLAAFSLFLGLLLLPFDTLPYFRGILREIGGMASFYPLSLGLIISSGLLLFTKDEFALPLSELSFKLAGLFLVWVFISFLVNWHEISFVVFKGRSGAVKGLLQLVMLAYCLAVSVYSFQAASPQRGGGPWISRFILLSFVLPATFSIPEILYLYKVSSPEWLLYLRPLISDDNRLYERLHSVSGEPSSFAFYCAFFAPWLMLKLVSGNIKRTIAYSLIFFYFIFMVVLTFSRAAYFMVFVGLAVFLALAYMKAESRPRVLRAAAFFFVCFWFCTLITPGGNVETVKIGGVSSQVRLAAQVANFRMANVNPFFGVGFAQAGFHMYKFIPDWDVHWPAEVLSWSNDVPGSPWAPSHGLHARIAAETGYPGLFLWCGMWLTIGAALLRRTLERSGAEALLGAVLCAAVSSCFLMGFNIDTFKFFEYWIVLGLGWAYLHPPANKAL